MEHHIVAPLWTALPGFFDFNDLYEDWAKKFDNGAVIVEVGSYLGRSACFLADQIKKSGKDIKLVCVDPWTPEFLESKTGDAIYENFLAAVRIGGFQNIIVPIRGTSLMAAKLLRDDLDAVFIDADHSYESVKSDIRAWIEKVRPGGVLAGHDFDYQGWPDVPKAVKEMLGEQFRLQGRCWVHDVGAV